MSHAARRSTKRSRAAVSSKKPSEKSIIPLPVSAPEPEHDASPPPPANEPPSPAGSLTTEKPQIVSPSPPTAPPPPASAPAAQPPAEEAPLDRANKMLMIAASMLLGGITVTSFSLTAWFRTSERFRTVNAPSPAPPIPTVPAATATPAPQRSTITLEVLNGSGVAGTAKKAADQLSALGYTIVKTGNAPQSTYQSTSVSVAPGQAAITALLLSDLSALSYAAAADGDLTDSTASARIIIGKK